MPAGWTDIEYLEAMQIAMAAAEFRHVIQTKLPACSTDLLKRAMLLAIAERETFAQVLLGNVTPEAPKPIIESPTARLLDALRAKPHASAAELAHHVYGDSSSSAQNKLRSLLTIARKTGKVVRVGPGMWEVAEGH